MPDIYCSGHSIWELFYGFERNWDETRDRVFEGQPGPYSDPPEVLPGQVVSERLSRLHNLLNNEARTLVYAGHEGAYLVR